MRLRLASINDQPIRESDRKFRWPQGQRPVDHSGLSDLGLQHAGFGPQEDVMPHRFAEIAFTPTVEKVQEHQGSRMSYARMEGAPETMNHHLSEAEAGFIATQNSLYMATVSETGWPYIQHRGGPTGFVRVLDETTIGFADFRGNRQYVSVGNLMTDDRIVLHGSAGFAVELLQGGQETFDPGVGNAIPERLALAAVGYQSLLTHFRQMLRES